MKRLTVTLACLSIFYASAVLALNGCVDFAAEGDEAHDSAASMNHPGHEVETASHDSHSDPTKVHCPDVFKEFLISSRVSLDSPLRSAQGRVDIADLRYTSLGDATPRGAGVGPPGSRHSQDFPRHLLLSVIRI